MNIVECDKRQKYWYSYWQILLLVLTIVLTS